MLLRFSRIGSNFFTKGDLYVLVAGSIDASWDPGGFGDRLEGFAGGSEH
jgi:hypothetical protein